MRWLPLLLLLGACGGLKAGLARQHCLSQWLYDARFPVDHASAVAAAERAVGGATRRELGPGLTVVEVPPLAPGPYGTLLTANASSIEVSTTERGTTVRAWLTTDLDGRLALTARDYELEFRVLAQLDSKKASFLYDRAFEAERHGGE